MNWIYWVFFPSIDCFAWQVRGKNGGEMLAVTVMQISDGSTYTVVFNDGDVRNIKRSSIHLKSEKHFDQTTSLDNMPLTQPEKISSGGGELKAVHRRLIGWLIAFHYYIDSLLDWLIDLFYSFPFSVQLLISVSDRTEEGTSKRRARNPSVASGAATEEESDTDSVRRSVRTKRPVTAAPAGSRGSRAAKREKLEKIAESADSSQTEEKVPTEDSSAVEAPATKKAKPARRGAPKRRWNTALVAASTVDHASSDEEETAAKAEQTEEKSGKNLFLNFSLWFVRKFIESIDCLIKVLRWERAIDWSIDWLIDWLNVRSIDWLIYRLNVRLIDWLIVLLWNTNERSFIKSFSGSRCFSS